MEKMQIRFICETSNTGIKKVIALGQYHGKVVRAVAKCSPEDEYSEEIGMELAEARLRQKLIKKRLNSAQNRLQNLHDEREALADAIYKYNRKIAEVESNIDDITDEFFSNEEKLDYLIGTI